MSSKHLKQLLTEDQEPFILQNYINEKRLQLNKKPLLKTQKQLKKPITENLTHFSRNACLFSFHHNSPLKSPIKTPCRNSNTLFVQIPAKTAALLLEAALRIQNQTEIKSKKTKNLKLGLFGKVLKRLVGKKKNDEIKRGCEIKVSVRDILRWDSNDDVCGIVSEEREEEKLEKKTSFKLEEKSVSDVGQNCYCNNSSSRVSSSAWTESNEEKSLDLDTSATSSSDETEFIVEQENNNDEFNFCEKGSPFRFALQNEPSPCCRSPKLISPATSPKHRNIQVIKSEGCNLASDGKEQKEEKEHYSPVSVLEFQPEDDVEGQDEDEVGNDLEQSFAFVQNMKKLVIDLMAEERAVAPKSSGKVSVPNKLLKRVCLLKNAERSTINMIVEMDFRGEDSELQRNREYLEETAIAIELAIFGFLVEELSVELSHSSDL
ncbi:hypothetical protein IFM89_013602 [Coptis chinensis]|uniref:DUF4378 domain-containing protein n=1 Tax=Coptis chinensis TaxID=261450 RepID=A0A835LRG1_9MAGN|nr:hypothetical protein IFM89_013602 [Coptis chinensis]